MNRTLSALRELAALPGCQHLVLKCFLLHLHPPARPVWAAAAYMCHGHYGEILANETACVPECTSSTGTGGLIPGTIAVCGRFASKHRVFSVMLGLCAVGFFGPAPWLCHRAHVISPWAGSGGSEISATAQVLLCVSGVPVWAVHPFLSCACSLCIISVSCSSLYMQLMAALRCSIIVQSPKLGHFGGPARPPGLKGSAAQLFRKAKKEA